MKNGFISGVTLIMVLVVSSAIYSGYLYWLNPASLDIKRPTEAELSAAKDDAFHFDFFSTLPSEDGSGVTEVPAAPAKQQVLSKPKDPQKKISQSKASGKYLVQLVAFGSMQKADQHKAKLTLQGVTNLKIEKVRTNKGVIYRLNVGPFRSLSAADQAKERLNKMGYSSPFIKKISS